MSQAEFTDADAFEALLAFWDGAGIDIAPARRIAAAAQRQERAGPPPAIAPAPVRAATAVAAPPAKDGPLALARRAAAAAQDLQALKAAVTAFEGCALKATAKSTVFADGRDDAPVMLIGEAPGRDEDERGLPFVGRSGQLLDRMLGAIGLSRQENVFITNIVYWRPPGNRAPTPGEVAVCRPFVERAISLVQPKVLVLVGGEAMKAMLARSEGVTKLRGRKLSFTSGELTQPLNAMVMLHPAYLLRRPQEKALAWADLLALEAWLEELGVPRSPRL